VASCAAVLARGTLRKNRKSRGVTEQPAKPGPDLTPPRVRGALASAASSAARRPSHRAHCLSTMRASRSSGRPHHPLVGSIVLAAPENGAPRERGRIIDVRDWGDLKDEPQVQFFDGEVKLWVADRWCIAPDDDQESGGNDLPDDDQESGGNDLPDDDQESGGNGLLLDFVPFPVASRRFDSRGEKRWKQRPSAQRRRASAPEEADMAEDNDDEDMDEEQEEEDEPWHHAKRRRTAAAASGETPAAMHEQEEAMERMEKPAQEAGPLEGAASGTASVQRPAPAVWDAQDAVGRPRQPTCTVLSGGEPCRNSACEDHPVVRGMRVCRRHYRKLLSVFERSERGSCPAAERELRQSAGSSTDAIACNGLGCTQDRRGPCCVCGECCDEEDEEDFVMEPRLPCKHPGCSAWAHASCREQLTRRVAVFWNEHRMVGSRSAWWWGMADEARAATIAVKYDDHDVGRFDGCEDLSLGPAAVRWLVPVGTAPRDACICLKGVAINGSMVEEELRICAICYLPDMHANEVGSGGVNAIMFWHAAKDQTRDLSTPG
jgi:hypothetical protein